MPNYNYKCEKCTVEDFANSEVDDQIIYISAKSENPYKEPFIFQVRHDMNSTKSIKCPICNNKCSKTYEGSRVTSYIRGNGYLDKAGCQRDMNRYRLERDDPYKTMREPGEKDHLMNQLHKAGLKPWAKNTSSASPAETGPITGSSLGKKNTIVET